MKEIARATIVALLVTMAGAAAAHPRHMEDYTAFSNDRYGSQVPHDVWIQPPSDTRTTATGGPSGGLD